jgi:predicted lipoprotein with Yx(FWY)xxD motif
MLHSLRSIACALAAAACLAACGSMDMSQGDAPAKAAHGVLVGTNGMTLYTFDKDAPDSGKSACNGPCATLWPPLMASADDKPHGAFSIVTRDDGSRQWAYKGRPLYFYQADQKAGDRNGDNFRGVWHVIKASSSGGSSY